MMTYFKIWNPIHNLFFGGMNADGQGGHSWDKSGRKYNSKRGAIISLRVALHYFPSDFELVEFNEKNVEIKRTTLDKVSKTRIVHPHESEYKRKIVEHIEIMGFGKPIIIDGNLILEN